MGDTELVRELLAVGLDCGVRDGEVAIWHSPASPDSGHLNLATLVISAHNQASDSEAVLKLKSFLGPESEEWTAYVAERNRYVRNIRSNRYASEADPLVLRALETAAVTASGNEYELRVPKAKWDEWLAVKAEIRSELPYPFEE